jgi:hypothetical protein
MATMIVLSDMSTAPIAAGGVRCGARRRPRRKDNQLLLEQQILRHHRAHATASTQLRGQTARGSSASGMSFMRALA